MPPTNTTEAKVEWLPIAKVIVRGSVYIDGADDRTVASILLHDKADYIIRATNAHAGLLATLKRIRAARDSIAEGVIPFALQYREFDDWAADQADAAIAKAEAP